MSQVNDTNTAARTNVLIAGGGVAGLEAACALHELAADRVNVTILAPGDEFVYRPNAVKEPFTLGMARHYPLAPLVESAGARLIEGALERVDTKRRLAYTSSGTEVSYDALIIALGARAHQRYDHVTTVDDARMDEYLHGLVQDVEEGYVKRLAVVIPAPPPWPLPAYELALLATMRAWEMQGELKTTVITVERAPLAVFGDRASAQVSQLLADRGIEILTSAYCEIPRAKTIDISPGGQHLEFDSIVAMPELRGPGLSGIPQDGDGFIPIDQFCAVRGADRVFAAGDAADFPIKHGGVAAQQAETAARSVAALAGAPILPTTLDPVLEGVLLTGDPHPLHFRAHLTGGYGDEHEIVGVPVEKSTPKIAARYLEEHLEPAR